MEFLCRCRALAVFVMLRECFRYVYRLSVNDVLCSASYSHQVFKLRVVEPPEVRAVGADLGDVIDRIVVIGVDCGVAVDMRAEIQRFQRLVIMSFELFKLCEGAAQPGVQLVIL